MAKKAKASEAVLNSLHDEFAAFLLARLRGGETELHKASDDTIIKTPVTCKASTLNVIRQFLKDNGIEGVAEENTPMKNLADELAKIDADKLDELSDRTH